MPLHRPHLSEPHSAAAQARPGAPGASTRQALLAAACLSTFLVACANGPAAPAPQDKPAAPAAAAAGASAPAAGDYLAAYPTSLRVEYVQECMNVNGGTFVLMYQCSCVLDRMATKFTHDDFVEAGTFAKYATLGGERGGEFRDSDRAKELGRRFRTEQAAAYKACNVTPTPRPK